MPVVLVHGTGLDQRMWVPQVNALQDFWCVTYDLRGFGRSSPMPPERYSVGDDFVAVLDELGAQQADIVGLSRGGRVAISVALDYPDRVRSLMLADPNIIGYMGSGKWDEVRQRLFALSQSGDVAEAKRVYMESALFTHARLVPEIRKSLDEMAADHYPWDWLGQDPELPREPSDLERLPSLRTPTHVVVGESDMGHFHRVARRIADSSPNTRLTVLEGAGHMSTMEAPEAFNAILLDHLLEIQRALDIPSSKHG